MLLVEIADSSVARMFQKISETILGWFCFEEDHFWARPTSTKVGTELTKVGTELKFTGYPSINYFTEGGVDVLAH